MVKRQNCFSHACAASLHNQDSWDRSVLFHEQRHESDWKLRSYLRFFGTEGNTVKKGNLCGRSDLENFLIEAHSQCHYIQGSQQQRYKQLCTGDAVNWPFCRKSYRPWNISPWVIVRIEICWKNAVWLIWSVATSDVIGHKQLWSAAKKRNLTDTKRQITGVIINNRPSKHFKTLLGFGCERKRIVNDEA